jgi:hypothetical protein
MDAHLVHLGLQESLELMVNKDNLEVEEKLVCQEFHSPHSLSDLVHVGSVLLVHPDHLAPLDLKVDLDRKDLPADPDSPEILEAKDHPDLPDLKEALATQEDKDHPDLPASLELAAAKELQDPADHPDLVDHEDLPDQLAILDNKVDPDRKALQDNRVALVLRDSQDSPATLDLRDHLAKTLNIALARDELRSVVDSHETGFNLLLLFVVFLFRISK